MRDTFTCLTSCFTRRTNTHYPVQTLSCHLGFQKHRSPLRDRSNSDPYSLSPSRRKRRERCRVDGRKPATFPRDAVAVVVPPGFRSLFPFVPLHALAGPRPHRRCAFRAVTRSVCRARRSSGACPCTREYDLAVATTRPAWLHSVLAMPWPARSSTAAARRVPVFLAGGPHFTGCPVPSSSAWARVDVSSTISLRNVSSSYDRYYCR